MGTQFFKGGIGLAFHGRTDHRFAGFQSTFGTTGIRLRGEAARFAPKPPPILDRAQTDPKMLGDAGLGKITLVEHGNHTFAEIK